MSITAVPRTDMTAEELAARVGAVPWWRIRTNPSPGSATEADLERIRHEEGVLCELIDGVMVEKAVSELTAFLVVELITLLNVFVKTRQLGWILGPNGFVRLFGTQLRAPDVLFIRRDQRPGGKLLERGYSEVAPALAVEVFSPGNTLREIEQKRSEFFAAGTEIFWIVFPDRLEVEVSTGPESHKLLNSRDSLDGGAVLPGFSCQLADLFAAAGLRHGSNEQ